MFPPGMEAGEEMAERLHKYLASCGLGSRRSCEQLILAGRVTVDGRTVTELGSKVEPGQVEVHVDGQAVRPEAVAYYLLHKPVGYLSTTRARRGVLTVLDLIPRKDLRLFIAGRLDVASEGLMLITNDGELTDLLTHPRYGVPKTYRVTVAGELSWRELRRLRKGVELEDGLAKAEEVSLMRSARTFAGARQSAESKADVTVLSGRKRMVRRMFAKLGFKVTRLRRVRVGLLDLGRLARGTCRKPKPWEMKYLRLLRRCRSHQAALERMQPGEGSPR